MAIKELREISGTRLRECKKAIGKALVRLHCPHWYYHPESPLEMGSLSRGVIVCNNCGKRKFIEQLKEYEILVEPRR